MELRVARPRSFSILKLKMIDVFHWTSSIVSLPLVQGVSAIQLCGSMMLANEISNLFRSASSPGNLLQEITITSDRLCRKYEEGEETNCGRRRESVGEKGRPLPRLYIKLSTPVPFVAETVTQKSDFLVTADAALILNDTCFVYCQIPCLIGTRH